MVNETKSVLPQKSVFVFETDINPKSFVPAASIRKCLRLQQSLNSKEWQYSNKRSQCLWVYLCSTFVKTVYQISMPSLAPSSHWVWVYSYLILNLKRAQEMASIFGIWKLYYKKLDIKWLSDIIYLFVYILFDEEIMWFLGLNFWQLWWLINMTYLHGSSKTHLTQHLLLEVWLRRLTFD